jgi:hypothetical protein
MSGPVAVALIAALGTAIVALINSFVTRGQARDARARLQKDLDAFGKLEKDSPEFSIMEEHIQRSVLILAYTERQRKAGLPLKALYRLSLALSFYLPYGGLTMRTKISPLITVGIKTAI